MHQASRECGWHLWDTLRHPVKQEGAVCRDHTIMGLVVPGRVAGDLELNLSCSQM